MTPSEKLEEMIERYGFKNVRTWYQKGAHRHMGGARWGANMQSPEGLNVSLHSWDTMTQCLRHGFVIEHLGGRRGHLYTEYEAHAKSSVDQSDPSQFLPEPEK